MPKGDGDDSNWSDQSTTISRARASKELGELFAEALKEPHSHQLGVCAKLGIVHHLHVEWMRAKREPGSDVAAYQMAVVAALDARRIADLNDMEEAVNDAPGTHAATVFNMRKHRHESRFRRFYDDPQKVEVSGPDQGPIQTQSSQLSDAEVDARLAALAAKRKDGGE